MANGGALQQFCALLGKRIYGQDISTGSWDGARCFEWLGSLKLDPTFKKKAQRFEPVLSTAAVILSSPIVDHNKLASRVRTSGWEEDDLHVVDGVVTNKGWSFWSGAHEVALDRHQWRVLLRIHLHWALEQVTKGNAPPCYIDHIIKVMVLPSAEQQKLPSFKPPASLGEDTPDNIAVICWKEWYRVSGGTEAFSEYALMSREQAAELNKDAAQFSSVMGGLEKVLRYASLQEPILRLREKLDEFFEKKATWDSAFQAVDQDRELSAKAFTPAQLEEIYADNQKVFNAMSKVYASLPDQLWRGERPSGLGAAPLVVIGIGATLALAYYGVVVWGISVYDTMIGRMNGRKTVKQQLAALDAMEKEAKLTYEQCVMGASPAEAQKCHTNYQLTLRELADSRARMMEALNGIENSKPQSDKEQTGLIMLGALAAVGAFAFTKR